MEILILIFGLFLGSFLGVVIDRLPRGEKFLTGRSHCDFCKHTLYWYDLIPIISFTLLLGKCRYCGKFIGFKYPIIELTTGIILSLSFLYFQNYQIWFLVVVLCIMSCLIVIFFTDLISGIIPDSILILLTFFGIIKVFLSHGSIINYIIAALVAFIFFLLLFLATKTRGIGFGDVKYAFSMGIILGFPIIITGVYLSFLTGGAIALILILIGKKRFGNTIPFGPFLVASTAVNMFWGEKIWIFFTKILGIG